MKHLIKNVEKKVNSMIISFYLTTLILLILCIIILWYDWVLRVMVAIFIFTVAVVFFNAGRKLQRIKNEIKSYFKF